MYECMKILCLTILMLALSFTIFAQNSPTVPNENIKVVFINTEEFGNSETGIKKLVEAYDSISKEFRPTFDNELKPLTEKLNSNAEEIKKIIASCYECINRIEKLIKENETLAKQVNDAIKQYEQSLSKRISEKVDPVISNIHGTVNKFEEVKGYKIVFEKTHSDNGCLTHENEIIDVTKEFIEYCNQEFEKENIK